MAEEEYSESGSPIYRYNNVTPKEFEIAIGDIDNITAITNHIEKNIGKIHSVFHEVVSDLVHIDVYWIKPTSKYPFHILVTSGMSDIAMHVPESMKGHEYTELCILLPANWSIEGANYELMTEVFKDEKNYWPVRWLKTIARFPHQYDTWVGNGHTIPNGENAEPFADNTKLGCMILLPSLSLHADFFKLNITNEKIIRFYCLFPLYKEEMEHKLKMGLNALIDRFEKHNIVDVIDINRKNTCLKRGLFGLW